MSISSTRWSAENALAIWVQFLPCPKRPWQKAMIGPWSPSRVTFNCVALIGVALTGSVCQYVVILSVRMRA